MYDILLVSPTSVDKNHWNSFLKKFPNTHILENIKSFQEVKEAALTKFFWVVWDNLCVVDDFDFSYTIPEWDEEYIHVFKNTNFFDGICIFSKKCRITSKEWDYRFFTNKKEIEIVASNFKKYDIVFMSYRESFADQNFDKLKSKKLSNNILRIDGVTGIHQAHIEAAKLVSTDMFYVVDADAEILPDFDFNFQIPYYDFNAKNSVYVWRSQNPVNGLIYGYGGVKLLPKQLTLNMDVSKPDMTTSISKQFRPQEQISNITAFNTDPFNTWKSAFRECAKLASRIIDRQDDKETQERLETWCNESNDEFARDGAVRGRIYGSTHRTNLQELMKINDFDWLKNEFQNR